MNSKLAIRICSTAVPLLQAKSLGMTTVLIQSKTMLEDTGYTLDRCVQVISLNIIDQCPSTPAVSLCPPPNVQPHCCAAYESAARVAVDVYRPYNYNIRLRQQAEMAV